MHPRDLDSWHGERALERAAAPRRHAVAAWLVAALLVTVGVFGGPATHQATRGLGELHQDVRLLDHELGRLSARLAMRTANAAGRLLAPHWGASGKG